MAGKINLLFNPLKSQWLQVVIEDFGLLGCDTASNTRRVEFQNHEEVRCSTEQNIRMAMSVESEEFRKECQNLC